MHRTQTYTAKLNPAVHKRLTAFMEQQRLLYNAALEERIGAYRKAGQSIDRDWNAALTILNQGLPERPPSGGGPRGALRAARTVGVERQGYNSQKNAN